MKILTSEEIKYTLLSIMNFMHETCERNNIFYVLCSGSCLGAVRHKGFIPWDDDIDVFVPRAQYDTLIKELNKNSGQYKALTFTNCDNYYYPFCKLVDADTVAIQEELNLINGMGLFVDIFPVDGLPEDLKIRIKHIKKVRRHSKLISIKNAVHTSNPIKNIIKKSIGLFFNNKKLCRKINYLATKYELGISKYAMDLVWGTKPFLYEDIKERILVPFENYYFYIPKNYDHYLKTIYGEYMKLPPENQRVSHDLKAYLK